MATTYTTNYHLGKQTDHGDKFDMDVITDDMDIIDAQMKANSDIANAYYPQIVEGEYIDHSDIAFFREGVMTGTFNLIDLGIRLTDAAANQPGVLRAYTIETYDSSSQGQAMQMLELPAEGRVFVRYGTIFVQWYSWKELTEIYDIYENSTITNSDLNTFYHGTRAGLLDTAITGASSDIYGIVRAYQMGTLEYMQIAEAVDGTRRTRYQSGTNWSAWA